MSARVLDFFDNTIDRCAIEAGTLSAEITVVGVSDIESIASIFSQGLFMIISDVLKMIIVLIFMLLINWKITGIVLLIMPVILIATNIFNKKMKIAFNEVRNEVANLNTFIQEETNGRVKVVQVEFREHEKNTAFYKG